MVWRVGGACSAELPLSLGFVCQLLGTCACACLRVAEGRGQLLALAPPNTHPPHPPTHPPPPPIAEGPPSATPPANQRDGEVPDGVTRTVFDSLFGYSNGGFGQTFNSGEAAPGGAAAASSHGWAARLRDYCDQVRAALRCAGPRCVVFSV